MKRCLLTLGVTLALSGCIQPDDLLPERTRKAQQDLRRAPLMHISCRELQTRYIASDVPWVIFSSSAGSQIAQGRGDLKAVMQKKGCRVPS